MAGVCQSCYLVPYIFVLLAKGLNVVAKAMFVEVQLKGILVCFHGLTRQLLVQYANNTIFTEATMRNSNEDTMLFNE